MQQPSSSASIIQLPSTGLMASVRQRIRAALQAAIDEELEIALGTKSYERSESRRGHRNGSHERSLVTEHGPAQLSMPRARLFGDDGTSTEWKSQLVARYQRRTAKVNAAILGAYFAGANSRRIRRALEPLLGDKLLSKSAISRVVTRLKEGFETWRTRDLTQEPYVYLYLDAIYLSVRMVRRVVKVPVQAVLGVREDGQKVLLALEIASTESTASWTSIVQGLKKRGLQAPQLVILDGNPGLCRAVREAWPGVKVQRCAKHKLTNLLSKAPKHCHAELKRDYLTITHAENAEAARSAYQAFMHKWTKLSVEVVRSLEEAGDELLTFTRFPQSQWKSLRTTNAIERVNLEFRRRTKTQGSFSNETSALILLYGLIAMGQIQLRKIDGYYDLVEVLKRAA